MAWPDIYVEVALGESPSDALSTYTWVDISDRVSEINIDGPSRDKFTGRCQPGRLTIVADNSDRGMDPFYGSPPIGGIMLPRTPIRVRAELSAVDNQLFTGYMDELTIDWLDPASSTVTVTATDAFGQLAGRSTALEVFPAQRTGTRIADILSRADWPSADTEIATGGYEMAAVTTSSSANTLELMQVAQDHEFGALFVGGDGKVKFVPRSTYVQWLGSYTFSDASTNDYSDVSADSNADMVINRVEVSNSGGELVQENRPGSGVAYGLKRWTKTDFQYADDSPLKSVGEFLCDAYQSMRRRFTSLTYSPTVQATWSPALQAEVGIGINVTRTPPGGGSAITRKCVIDQVRHRIVALGSSNQGHWTTTFQLTDLTDSDLTNLNFAFWDLATWGSSSWYY